MAIPAPSAGEVYGHYRLVEQIGAGGMGVVYRAYDERLHRDVALKILPPGLFADEAARRQFRNEAFTVGKLNHPNIAMAFDFGHENGVDYLVTEYVAGINLDEKIAQQPLPQKSVIEWGMQLASGLDAAHRAGVIHRDLKPGNLRLTPDGHLKILDFGLARQILPLDDTEDTINIETEPPMSGTLPYMAPEILRGDLADVRSDIWAAGAVLYEMATGKRAYPDRQHTLLVDAILHYDPVRPSLLNPKLSAAFEAVILKALDRDPERRYQSARELRVDLARIAAGENPTDTIHRTAVLEVAAKARRRKLLLGLTVVLVAGMVLGYVLKRMWEPHSGVQKIMAVLPFDTVGQDQATNALGLGLTETLTAKLVQASNSDAIQLVSPRELRDRGVKSAADARREFGTDLVLEGTLQQSGQQLRIICNLVDSRTERQVAARTVTADSSDIFGLQDRVVRETLDMLPAQFSSKQRRQLAAHPETKPAAYEAYIRGRGYLQEYQKSENIDNALAEFTRATQLDPNYAPAYAGLGEVYWTGFRPPMNRGRDWLTKATQSCEKSLSLDPQLAEGHTCLGNVLRATGEYEKSVEQLQRAVELDSDSDVALLGLADAYQKLGNAAAAEATYKKAIALRPKYWAVYSWLGSFYYQRARYGDAANMFRKAIELAPDNYRPYSNLGAMYLMQGQYPESVEALTKSISLRPTLSAYSNLGAAYFLSHRYSDAVVNFRQGLKLDDQDWLNWGNLGDALYWSSEHRPEALKTYKTAISLARGRLEVNPKDATTLAYIAAYSAMLDDRKPAFDDLQQALALAPNDPDVMSRAALVYNHFGDRQQTLLWLKKAADAGFSRTIIRDTPDFAGLQNDPTFRDLLPHN